MNDHKKTKAQLLAELTELRQEVSRLKSIEDTLPQEHNLLYTLQDIQNSEVKFRTLYEATSDAVMVLDENGFIDCNEATLKMFGYDSWDQFINTHPGEQSPPTQPDGQDSRVAADEKIATAMTEGSNRFEWMYRRTDGSLFPAEVLLTARKLEGKRVLQAVVREITARKQVEDALRASEARNREL